MSTWNIYFMLPTFFMLARWEDIYETDKTIARQRRAMLQASTLIALIDQKWNDYLTCSYFMLTVGFIPAGFLTRNSTNIVATVAKYKDNLKDFIPKM